MMKKNNSLRDLQLCELEVLKEVVKFCEKNHLTYYISGGTYLGAVRHHGFIPWDDDVDIAMPRSDYERFLSLKDKFEKQSNFKINNYQFTDDYIFYPTRVVNEKIKVKSTSAKEDQIWSAWVDVFPLDGLPKNPLLRWFHKMNLLEKRLLLKYSCFNEVVNLHDKHRNIIERFFIFIGKHVNFEKYLNTKKRLDKLDKTLKKYSDKDSLFYMNYMGAYKFKSIMEKSLFYGEGAYYDFEGLKLFGPKNYDLYLTRIYGDYMKIPSKEEQNKHNTELIEDDKI